MHCVYTRVLHPHIPRSIEGSLIKLLGSRIYEAVEYLSYVDPKYADDGETMVANHRLYARLQNS